LFKNQKEPEFIHPLTTNSCQRGAIPKFAALETAEIQSYWKQIQEQLESRFGQKPDMNGVLFIIGIRELGQLPEKKFSKEEKVSLMHIAVCKVLSYSGYYELTGMDQDGWPIWENRIPLPFVSVFEQETMLRRHVVEYFINEQLI
jgi:hypothetical protein